MNMSFIHDYNKSVVEHDTSLLASIRSELEIMNEVHDLIKP